MNKIEASVKESGIAYLCRYSWHWRGRRGGAHGKRAQQQRVLQALSWQYAKDHAELCQNRMTA